MAWIVLAVQTTLKPRCEAQYRRVPWQCLARRAAEMLWHVCYLALDSMHQTSLESRLLRLSAWISDNGREFRGQLRRRLLWSPDSVVACRPPQ
jgi:hypothetical protein